MAQRLENELSGEEAIIVHYLCKPMDNYCYFRVNKREVLRKDWMFKLVGKETFTIGNKKTPCIINIAPHGGFSYQYTLEVDGKTLKVFSEKQSKVQ